MVRRFLDFWGLLMAAIVATLMVVFWLIIVNRHLHGRLSEYAGRVWTWLSGLVDRALDGPRTVAFREWGRRFWKVEEE